MLIGKLEVKSLIRWKTCLLFYFSELNSHTLQRASVVVFGSFVDAFYMKALLCSKGSKGAIVEWMRLPVLRLLE